MIRRSLSLIKANTSNHLVCHSGKFWKFTDKIYPESPEMVVGIAGDSGYFFPAPLAFPSKKFRKDAFHPIPFGLMHLPYSLIIQILLLSFLFSCNSNTSEKASLPNIIVLLADDLGYGDLSCYGSQSIHTPNLDQFASKGMRFTRFYAGSAVCSPSRACLLTGKFPLRFGITRHFNDREMHLTPKAVTLPQLLKKQGYSTAHIGKWHLGGLRIQDFEARQKGEEALPGPMEHGFDHYLCNIEDPLIRPDLIKNRQLYRGGGKTMVRNDQRADMITKHWTEIKIDEAIGLLEDWKEKEQPFFLNLWFDVPHTPYEPAPEPHLSRYKALGAEGDQLFFRSMVSHLDAEIGRLMEKLEELGLKENTLILFASDNGPAFQGSPGPFKGGKTDLHEGGIRVPMMAIWSGKIPANSYSFQTVHMADFLPTILSATGNTEIPQDLDGINVLPHLTSGINLERKTLFWQMDLYTFFQNQGPKPRPYATTVALNGRWKMLADSLMPTELFDLETDHRELYNLLGEESEMEEMLVGELERFLAAPRVK